MSVAFEWNSEGLRRLSPEERATYEATRMLTKVAAGDVFIDSVGVIMLATESTTPTSAPHVVVGREVYSS